MDGCEKTARLEWWANRSTCLARFPVDVTATARAGEWTTVVRPPLGPEARGDLQQFIEIDPCFTLCFKTSAVDVRVQGEGEVQAQAQAQIQVLVRVQDLGSLERLRVTPLSGP